MSRMVIRRYDHRMSSMSDAAGAAGLALDECECEEPYDCVLEMHSRIFTAILVEDTPEWCYILWVEDEDESVPVYMVQRHGDHPTEMMALLTEQMANVLREMNPQIEDFIRRTPQIGEGEQECDSP